MTNLYKNIMAELSPRLDELDTIKSELKLMKEFNHNSESDLKHKKGLDVKVSMLKKEISWWESELDAIEDREPTEYEREMLEEDFLQRSGNIY